MGAPCRAVWPLGGVRAVVSVEVSLLVVITVVAFAPAGCGHGVPSETPRVAAGDDGPLGALGAPSQEVAGAWLTHETRCDGCHPQHAREHVRSAHGRAFTHPVFRAEYARTSSPACARCHAPLAVPEAPSVGTERGIGCTVCHAVAARRDEMDPTSCIVAAEATPRAGCATCHEFPSEWLETPGEYAPGQLLQRTVLEHAQSSAYATGSGCVDCHAPPATRADGTLAGYTSHAWLGGRDVRTLRASFELQALTTRDGDEVRVTLRMRSRAGHSVPTGDVYRALVVEVADADRTTGTDGTARSDLTQLERQFEETPLGLREVGDTRLPADGTPREFVLTLPRDVERVRVVVEWQALRPSVAGARRLSEDDVRVVALDDIMSVPDTVTW